MPLPGLNNSIHVRLITRNLLNCLIDSTGDVDRNLGCNPSMS